MIGWLVVGLLAGRLVGWLVGWFVGWKFPLHLMRIVGGSELLCIPYLQPAAFNQKHIQQGPNDHHGHDERGNTCVTHCSTAIACWMAARQLVNQRPISSPSPRPDLHPPLPIRRDDDIVDREVGAVSQHERKICVAELNVCSHKQQDG